MLTQLICLSQRVGNTEAVALAVYRNKQGADIVAQERGPEGVACIDDAARALLLWCDVWERTHLPIASAWIDALLAFCYLQQTPDGRFLNFIVDWTGTPNRIGPTSRPDASSFWQARGAQALARVWRVRGDKKAGTRYQQAATWFDKDSVPSDVRCLHILAALDANAALTKHAHTDTDGAVTSLSAGHTSAQMAAWCEELLEQRSGPVLLDSPDASAPHLWGHIQEGVLALASGALDRPDLLAVACASADAYLLPLVRSRYDLPLVQPYGVGCAVFSLEQLYHITGQQRYMAAALASKQWFLGYNHTGAVVYDLEHGVVYDGLDTGRKSTNSGAESNIVGAATFLEEVATWLLANPGATPLPEKVLAFTGSR